jgi:hypothetical protein
VRPLHSSPQRASGNAPHTSSSSQRIRGATASNRRDRVNLVEDRKPCRLCRRVSWFSPSGWTSLRTVIRSGLAAGRSADEAANRLDNRRQRSSDRKIRTGRTRRMRTIRRGADIREMQAPQRAGRRRPRLILPRRRPRPPYRVRPLLLPRCRPLPRLRARRPCVRPWSGSRQSAVWRRRCRARLQA